MAKLFGRLNLQHLKNSDWFQFMSDYRDEVRNVGAETLKLMNKWDLFIELWQKADIALRPIIESEYTKKLEELDKKRDALFSGLHGLVKSFMKNYNTDRAAAANRLNIVFKVYGNVAVEDRAAETADIYNLVQELKTNHAADLTLLSLTADVTELDKANKEYKNLVETRNDKNTAKELPYTLRSIRSQLNAVYLEMIVQIEVLVGIEGEATWKDFIRLWNGRIDYYKELLARQESLHHKE